MRLTIDRENNSASTFAGKNREFQKRANLNTSRESSRARSRRMYFFDILENTIDSIMAGYLNRGS